jgi:hypothetical protein
MNTSYAALQFHLSLVGLWMETNLQLDLSVFSFPLKKQYLMMAVDKSQRILLECIFG